LAALILSCIENAKCELEKHAICSVEGVLGTPERIVYVAPDLGDGWNKFYKHCMFDRLFKDKDVKASEYRARKIVADLFRAYLEMPDLIDGKYGAYCKEAYRAVGVEESLLDIIVARNYVAGMTDPFATNQHKKLFMSSEPVTCG
jgi:dGTP triphosphohydrolase